MKTLIKAVFNNYITDNDELIIHAFTMIIIYAILLYLTSINLNYT